MKEPEERSVKREIYDVYLRHGSTQEGKDAFLAVMEEFEFLKGKMGSEGALKALQVSRKPMFDPKRLPPGGTRVAAYEDREHTRLIGYGTMEDPVSAALAFEESFGHPVPDCGVQTDDGFYAKSDYESSLNPRIRMDDGRYLYGMQVWWKAAEPPLIG